MSLAEAVQKYLPPLAAPKRPGLAAIIGVLFGGVGLAIYFRSLRDLLPLEVVGTLVIVGSAIAGVPLLDVLSVAATPAAIFGGSYGYWRADSSNRRLTAPRVAGGLVGSAG
ncbi:MAG: hypothetical protein ACR2H2_00880 [Solirubrobacteraceae bacterium]